MTKIRPTKTSRWATKIILENWREIQNFIGSANYMPIEEAKGRFAKEHGCGAFGCVFKTHRQGVVIKITEDEGEAALAETIVQRNSWKNLDGIVRYYRTCKLPTSIPTYILWREEAYDVGITPKYDMSCQLTSRGKRSAQLFVELIQEYGASALQVWNSFNASKNRDILWNRIQALFQSTDEQLDCGISMKAIDRMPPEQKLTAYFCICHRSAAFMEENEFGSEIGRSLSKLLNDNVLLTDMRRANIGLVLREGKECPTPVIIDPGHVIAFHGANMNLPAQL